MKANDKQMLDLQMVVENKGRGEPISLLVATGKSARTDTKTRETSDSCQQCHLPFFGLRPKRKFCSVRCRAAAQVKYSLEHTCLQCGVRFFAFQNGDHPRKFCSRTCHHQFQNGGRGGHKELWKAARERRFKRVGCAPGGRRGLATRLRICVRDNWTCGICGQKIDRTLKYPDQQSASLEHVIAVCNGGKHVDENFKAAHLGCNVQKSALDYWYFIHHKKAA